MGKFIENRMIGCHICGYPSVRGRVSEQTKHNGDILVECKWVCPRCNQVVRRDEKLQKHE